jgi:cation diffusion facilitator CzcD-associated flavoprotein CzcO
MGVAQFDAVIVGAGFSGLAAAVELKGLGYANIVILEREDDLGGTWHVNRYPGVAVDICSMSYQYWFEPNPQWSRLYAKGPELKRYVDDVAAKYDLRRHVRFRTAAEKAVWDADEQVWRVGLSDGDTVIGRFLISATGFLSQRHYPDIPGLDGFAGTVLHTTWWDPDTDLTGRRVGVIGTGATSVQLVPEVAKQAAELTVYQRTPIWVTPKIDFPMPAVARRLLTRVPLLQRVLCGFSDAIYEVILMSAVLNHRRYSALAKFVEFECKALLFLTVGDRALRKKLLPDYSFGCKRPALSNSYYRTFDKPHVYLETIGIDRIEADGIVTRDGAKTQLDTLILATGFNVWDHNFPAFETIGRSGVDLGKWWRDRRYESYQGVTVPNFPNYVAMTCPWAFTGLSYFSTIKGQTVHMNRLFGEMRKRGATVFEVTGEANADFMERMRAKMDPTVLYHGSCATSNSYYYNPDGDAAWFRPTSTRDALREQSQFPVSDYRIA